MKNSNLIILLIIITVTLVFRLLPHLPNFVPFGAAALLLGSQFTNKKMALGILFGALFLGDFLLQIDFWTGKSEFSGFHATMPFVYFSFFLYLVLGKFINGKMMIPKSLGVAVIGSVLFFIITNFGVWATGALYTKNFEGLISCYTLAIPFYKTTLISDLIYTFAFFSVHQLYTIVSVKYTLARA
jgi:hypothetical protein